ncbi:SanA/YdcF family protein [Paractinoplanes abujensis]|uniref:Vancomycin permeability regulator SanA n=1 Tax=Paractinoplanes abujensis TaxID=882441 RepID=A0A7W7CUG8_9ACTN|nr:ElyC/SanA/YdcF family protein [Actinoplanes abujensis]MBB4693620.1 vancomycin permeability regulator SanA [Actinoplanes abujensis]
MRSRLITWVRPRRLVLVAAVLVLLVSAPWMWTTTAALGHVHDAAEAPAADVVIVLGTTVGAGGQPEARLAGRLQTAAELVAAGRARTVLVSGDGGGDSGDEPAAMTAYLTGPLGVDAARVVADPYGLDTYDSCIRARDVFGVRRALVVTQAYHLSRAVTVCRSLGLDADGVKARCDGCGRALLAEKAVRDYFASGKAAWDVVRQRPPAVS